MLKGWIKAGVVALVLSVCTGFIGWFVIPFIRHKFVDSLEGTSR